MSTPLLSVKGRAITLVGRGYCSDVYAWGEGRVLKLFHSSGGPARAEREYRATRAVHAAGLPAPAAYEMLEIEGRCGIVLERVDGPSALGYLQTRPWELFDALKRLAELHAQINNCPAPADLPPQRDWIASRINAVSDLSETDRQATHRQLANLPDGTAVCHGDFHPGNVLFTKRGLVVIDWDTATRGHPMGDVACTSRLLRNAGLPPWAPGFMHLLLRCLRPTMHRAYLRQYLRLQPGSRREIAAWEIPLAAGAKTWRMMPGGEMAERS